MSAYERFLAKVDSSGGSVRGYSRHRRHGERTCQPCRDAVATYQRGRAVAA